VVGISHICMCGLGYQRLVLVDLPLWHKKISDSPGTGRFKDPLSKSVLQQARTRCKLDDSMTPGRRNEVSRRLCRRDTHSMCVGEETDTGQVRTFLSPPWHLRARCNTDWKAASVGKQRQWESSVSGKAASVGKQRQWESSVSGKAASVPKIIIVFIFHYSLLLPLSRLRVVEKLSSPSFYCLLALISSSS
jgi:hypothetical protein